MKRRIIFDPQANESERASIESPTGSQDVEDDGDDASETGHAEAGGTALRLEVLERLASEVSEIGTEFRRLSAESAEAFARLPD